MSNLIGGGTSSLALLQRIEALEKENEKIKTKTLTIESGITVIYNDYVTTLNISTGNRQLASGWSTIAEIPEGVRPKINITFAGLFDTQTDVEPLFIRLQTDGLLVVWVPSKLTNVKCYGNITYLR